MKELLKRQTLIALLMAMVASFALVSCGDDDEDVESSAIVGEWSETYEDEDELYTVTFTFDSNGTFTYINRSADNSDVIIHKGTYEFNSGTNRLVLRNIDGGTGTMYWTCKISGKTMILTDDDGESFRLTKK